MIIVILCFVLFVIAIAFLASGVIAAPLITRLSPDPSFTGLLGYYSGVFSVLIFPTILGVSYLIRKTWGYHTPLRYSRAFTGVWIVCTGIFLTTAAFTARAFSSYYSSTEYLQSEKPETELFEIEGTVNQPPRANRVYFGNHYYQENDLIIYQYLKSVNIEPSPDDKIHISLTRSSRGASNEQAKKNANKNKGHIELSPDKLIIDNSNILTERDKFRAQKLDYTVQIPIDQKIKVHKNMTIAGRASGVYQMTTSGLKYLMNEN